MAKQRQYGIYICLDCDVSFMVANKVGTTKEHRRYCPVCGDDAGVNFDRFIWMPRTFNHKRPWTEEEDQIIVYGRGRGDTYKEIAEALEGRTPEAARNRAYQLIKLGVLTTKKWKRKQYGPRKK